MQTRPDQSTLLDAVASFLLSDVVPRLEKDKAAQFRVLIAANLAGMVGNELRTQDARLAAELWRLKELLGQDPGDDLDALQTLNRELARRLRAGALQGPALDAAVDHLFATARETLAVTNPRFDLSEDPS